MTRITKFGDLISIVMPPETLRAADLAEGDEVTIHPVKDGLIISASGSPQGRMLAAALSDMENRPDLYNKLAK